MYTVHTMKSDLIKKRVHVAPVGFEIDRVVKPAVVMEAHMVYLIVDQNVSRDKSTKFQDEIIKQLKKKNIASKKIYADRLRLFDNIRVVKEIILEHRKDDVYVNVASGSKIHAIACMMACMIFDDRTNIHPYYPEAKDYPAYNLEKQQTTGIGEIHKLPKYQLRTPNKELIEILKIIRENKGRIQKKELAEIAEERNILNINARDENHSQARYASLDKKFIQPLKQTWNFIEEEKIGKNRWVSFTHDGLKASEFLF